MKKTTLVKSVTALGAGALLAIAVPLAASAHVTINPSAAEAGSYSVITVKVPNESATASTTRVEVNLPTDTPFTSVRYVPVAGWTTELVTEDLPEPVTVNDTEISEAITTVIWTADAGSEIGDGQLQQFQLSLGPVPDVGSVTLPTDQFYSDGSVVSWSETEEDAELPAPVLYINDEAPTDHHGGAATHSDSDSDATVVAESSAGGSSIAGAADDVLARILGLGGLVLGAAALVLAITARRSSTK
jgi:uncharacterized protein YcnI